MRAGPRTPVGIQLQKAEAFWADTVPFSRATLIEQSDLSLAGYMEAVWWS
jgi:hypothetical protein